MVLVFFWVYFFDDSFNGFAGAKVHVAFGKAPTYPDTMRVLQVFDVFLGEGIF